MSDDRAAEWAATMMRIAGLVADGEIPVPFSDTSISWFFGDSRPGEDGEVDDGKAEAAALVKALGVEVQPDDSPPRNYLHTMARMPGVIVNVYTRLVEGGGPDRRNAELADQLNQAARRADL